MTPSGRYAYRAAQPGGAVERGIVSAPSPEEVRSALKARGLFPLEVRPEDAGHDLRSSIPAQDLAAGLRALATLLDAGLPVGRAIDTLRELAPPAWGPVVPVLREGLRQGLTLAAALEVAPVHIPAVMLGLIRAGEAGSGLGRAVIRAAELAEEDAATRRALRGELAYPLLLFGSGGVSIVVIVGFVLPRFAAILADLGGELPATTSFVLRAGAIAREGWVPALFGTLFMAVVLRVSTANPAGLRLLHGWILRVPVAGPVRRSAAVSRFSAALGGLLEAGVPIAPALLHAAGAAGDAALHGRFLAARRRVIDGSSLSAALDVEDAATPTALRLVRTGEETGRLSQMLTHAGRIEAEAARVRLQAAVRLLQPALVLGFGVTVAVVAAALLQAVYRVRPGG